MKKSNFWGFFLSYFFPRLEGNFRTCIFSYSMNTGTDPFPDQDQQCSGSVTFGHGSRFFDPYTGLRILIQYTPSVAFKMPTKNKFFSMFLKAYYLLVSPFTSVFKDNKSLRSYKPVEIKVFHNFFSC